jgi:tetratricopeptide (TPR) repeat protein
MARCLNDLGEVARYRGDFEKAKIYYEEANQLSPHKRSVGDTMMDLNLGSVYRNLGDSERAWEIYEKVYSHARKNELPLRAADCLSGWAGILIEHGKLELAATLLSTAEAVEESIGSILEPADKSVIDRDIVALRERLDRETLDAAWKRGRAMTLDDAATLAMEAQVFEQQKD